MWDIKEKVVKLDTQVDDVIMDCEIKSKMAKPESFWNIVVFE